MGPKWGFCGKEGVNVKCWFCDPKKVTSLRGTASFDVFCVSVCDGVLAVGERKYPKNSRVNNRREFAHAWKRNPLSDLDKILQDGRYPDIITCANFGDDRLRGLGVAGGQILPFPIGIRRHPYNTLALPCECVIVFIIFLKALSQTSSRPDSRSVVFV